MNEEGVKLTLKLKELYFRQKIDDDNGENMWKSE